MFFPDHFLR